MLLPFLCKSQDCSAERKEGWSIKTRTGEKVLLQEWKSPVPSGRALSAPTAALTHYPPWENSATVHSATSCLSHQCLSSFDFTSGLWTFPTSLRQCLTSAQATQLPIHTLGLLSCTSGATESPVFLHRQSCLRAQQDAMTGGLRAEVGTGWQKN